MAYKIMIDAGHFANQNIPKNYPQYSEGNQMWKLQNHLANELKTYGFTVSTTRNANNVDLAVYDRGQKANGYDLMISLHSNACDTESVRRVVVIPPFIDRNNTNVLADKLGKAVSDCMGITEKFQRYTRTYKQNDIEYDYYGVIRGAVAAGCKRSLIIEHSFHTNNKTAQWLNNDSNLQKLAQAEAKTIADYFGVKKQTITNNQNDTNKNAIASLNEMKQDVSKLSSKIDSLIKSLQT